MTESSRVRRLLAREGSARTLFFATPAVATFLMYYVYILASHQRVLYTGVTRKLERRSFQHRHDQDPDSFSARYRVHKLVYFETFSRPQTAIAREKEIKGWRREKKIALIESKNPKWGDLSAGWGKAYREWPTQPASRGDESRQVPRAPTDGALGMTSASGMTSAIVRPAAGMTGAKGRSAARRTVVQQSVAGGTTILRLASPDDMNRLTREVIEQVTGVVERLAARADPLIFTGNAHFFSAGADLHEIAALNGPEAFEFARAGQRLMRLIDDFPALTVAAISGYCMGGGLDLALACDVRLAAPNGIFGHRGAALGLITGWGGTQRLPRLVGKGRALQMFCAAEKLHAKGALAIGLVNFIAEEPVAAALVMANGKWQMAKAETP